MTVAHTRDIIKNDGTVAVSREVANHHYTGMRDYMPVGRCRQAALEGIGRHYSSGQTYHESR